MPPRTPHPTVAAQGSTRSLRNWWRRGAQAHASTSSAPTVSGSSSLDARSNADPETQAHQAYLQRLREAGL